MKNLSNTIILAIAVLLSTFLSSCTSKSIAPYLESEGIELLANYAHPTSKMDNYKYNISGDHVNVDIRYTNGYYISLDVVFDGSEFTSITVVRDSDWWGAFLAAEIFKNAVMISMNNENYNDSKGVIASFENRFKKNILELTGKEVTLYIMTLGLNNFEV